VILPTGDTTCVDKLSALVHERDELDPQHGGIYAGADWSILREAGC
jgi:hypothetical protein